MFQTTNQLFFDGYKVTVLEGQNTSFLFASTSRGWAFGADLSLAPAELLPGHLCSLSYGP